MNAATVAAALLALTACTNGTASPKSTGEPTPIVGIDECPKPETLLAKAEQPTKGNRLPDVTLPCLGHGGTVALRALGKVPTVVNLWGSWCFPCRTEMPQFQQVHAALGAKVRFLGVDTKDFDRPARVAIQNAAITYANVTDPDEKVGNALSARSLPTTVIVGADGLIKNVHVGELTGAELRALLTKHVGVS
jgi:thiol-disulfide isomerase/thioredoxin